MNSFKQITHLFIFMVFFYAPACLAAGETRVEQSSIAANREVKFAPREAKRHIEGGLQLEKRLDLFGAIESYSKAATLVPDSAEVHFLLAEALTKAERFQDALVSYTLAVNFAPDHTKALYQRVEKFLPTSEPKIDIAVILAVIHSEKIMHSSKKFFKEFDYVRTRMLLF